jgi:hypothetical protein
MYVSFATFTTFLDWIKDMTVMPSQIDRSLWGPKFQGGTGGQLMVGLRFLHLLDGERPTPMLENLARADSTGRAQLMTKVLADAYGQQMIDDLVRYTPKMLNDHLEGLGSTDATKRKAVSFLVNAARASNIPIAPAIAKQARNKAPRTVKGAPRGRTPAKPPAKNPEGNGALNNGAQQPPAPQANTRTVELASGGRVVLTLTVDLFELSEHDRKFVLGLVDDMRKYEAPAKPLELAAPHVENVGNQ